VKEGLERERGRERERERERDSLIEKEREKCLNNIEEIESIRQRVKAREKE
jgi:hypothetical protein